MANYASFRGKIVGHTVGDVLMMVDAFACNWSYDEEGNYTGEEDIPYHLYGIENLSYVPDYEDVEGDDGYYSVEIDGDVRWSFVSSILDASEPDEKSRRADIRWLCNRFNCSFEGIDCEPGCAFSEHIIIDYDGSIITNASCDYIEIYIGDYKNYEELSNDENMKPFNITEDEYIDASNSGSECIIRSDFGDIYNWEFEI